MPDNEADFETTPAMYQSYVWAVIHVDDFDPQLMLWARDDMREFDLEDDQDVIDGDRALWAQRERLVPILQKFYDFWRPEDEITKSAWWWWLDEIVAGTYTEALPVYLSE